MANSNDIQLSILELQSRKSKLGLKKQKLQANISNYKEMLKVVTQGHETFEEIVEKKKALVSELNEIDLEIAQIKQDLRKRQLLKEEVKETEQPKTLAVEAELIVLRDNYLKFAGDKTRVASMRAMAADFAGELTKVLKRLKK